MGEADSASCLEKELDHLSGLRLLRGIAEGSWRELLIARPLSKLMTHEGSWPLPPPWSCLPWAHRARYPATAL